jgi:hypothetical protein
MRTYAVISTLMLLLIAFLFTPVMAKSETVFIVANKDNTLIQNPLGSLSNGSGPYLFVGRTNQNANYIRRGLVHFDVASALPAGARIKSAQFMIYLSKSQNFVGDISLHTVLSDWGQGTSSAIGGTGAPAALDDATWLNTFYPDFEWTTMGGDYSMDAIAVITVGPDAGPYTWESRKMIADVQSWLMNPNENFGWILIGDESIPQSVMRFSSREVTCSDAPLSVELPPLLMVTYK